MSWRAARFQRPAKWQSIPGLPLVPGTNIHHMPPRNPAPYTPVKKRILKADHDAYHRLFQNAANPEQCIEILIRDFWPQYLHKLNYYKGKVA